MARLAPATPRLPAPRHQNGPSDLKVTPGDPNPAVEPGAASAPPADTLAAIARGDVPPADTQAVASGADVPAADTLATTGRVDTPASESPTDAPADAGRAAVPVQARPVDQASRPAWVAPEPAPPADRSTAALTRRQALERERGTQRHGVPPRRRTGRVLLRLLVLLAAALAVAAAGVVGGPATALMLAGGLVLAVGVTGLVIGRVHWARIGSRPAAALAALVGIALAVTGVVLSPLPLGDGTAGLVERGTDLLPDRPASILGDSANPAQSAADQSQPDPDALIATAAPGTALALLGRLPVRAERSLRGYRPEAFLPIPPTNGNCTVEQRVLLRDVQRLRRAESDPCEVRSGVLVDPYTGGTLPYLYAQPGPEVRLDFVVMPTDAWRTGAHAWSQAKLRQFASDPNTMLATAGRTTLRPGRWDAASWLPPAASRRCPHVARQIAVKARYRLAVTPAERAAMATVLSSCERVPGARML